MKPETCPLFPKHSDPDKDMNNALAWAESGCFTYAKTLAEFIRENWPAVQALKDELVEMGNALDSEKSSHHYSLVNSHKHVDDLHETIQQLKDELERCKARIAELEADCQHWCQKYELATGLNARLQSEMAAVKTWHFCRCTARPDAFYCEECSMWGIRFDGTTQLTQAEPRPTPGAGDDGERYLTPADLSHWKQVEPLMFERQSDTGEGAFVTVAFDDEDGQPCLCVGTNCIYDGMMPLSKFKEICATLGVELGGN